jgi:hypothetical protein
MPGSTPTAQDLHVDPLMSLFSVQYMNEPDAYVADKAFPIVPVRKQSAKYPVYLKSQFFRDVADIRSPGQESTGSGYDVDNTNSYYCDNYATHVNVADEERENADEPYDPDIEATSLVVDRLKIRREIAFATDFFTTGVWGSDKAGVTDFVQFSDYGNSAPIEVIDDYKDDAYSTTAVELDKVIMARKVFTQIKHHPDLLERIKYTQRGVLTVDLVRSLLDLRSLMIARAIKVTSLQGVAEASATYDWIFGKHILMYYTPDRPTLRRPSAGYTFHWNRFGAISFMRRLRNDFKMYDRIEGHTHFDQKKIAADCGWFLSDAVA